MNNTEKIADLKNINSKILASGETLPCIKLKDGTKVQTGTVAAMLHNIKLYNTGERGSIETELAAAIPTLIKAGIFDLFPPEEWIEGENAGRSFIGEAALNYMPERKKSIFPRFLYI